MAINSKQKGNTAERAVAKILSEKLGGSFQRVPSSGSFIGGKNAGRKEFLSETQIRASKSDIIPPDEFYNLVIEVKFYKDLPYANFATDTKIALIDGWLKELDYDCDEGDVGILCFKTNNKKWSIGMKKDYLDTFNLSNYVIYNNHFITGLESFLDENSEQLKSLLGKKS